MTHAETCPICWGKGKLQEHGCTAVDNKTCHGCNGQGWVSVQDEPQTLLPWAIPGYPWLHYPDYPGGIFPPPAFPSDPYSNPQEEQAT